jgi:hypothetical protein
MGASQATGLAGPEGLEPSGLHPSDGIPRALKPGDRRYTVQTIACGQPRAYADTIHHARVTFEWVPYKNRAQGEEPTFEPCEGWSEEAAGRRLKGLCCGFTDFVCPPNPTMDDHFRTHLDWLREVAPGVWEFHTTAAYDD